MPTPAPMALFQLEYESWPDGEKVFCRARLAINVPRSRYLLTGFRELKYCPVTLCATPHLVKVRLPSIEASHEAPLPFSACFHALPRNASCPLLSHRRPWKPCCHGATVQPLRTNPGRLQLGGTSPLVLAESDVSGDGKLDLVVASYAVVNFYRAYSFLPSRKRHRRFRQCHNYGDVAVELSCARLRRFQSRWPAGPDLVSIRDEPNPPNARNRNAWI